MKRFLLAALALAVAACDDSPAESTPDAGAVVSSRAYKGHESERDTTAFVSAYPAAQGTRLDDCQTCHRGGTFTTTGSKPATVTKNACDFCHLIQHPDPAGFAEAQPTKYSETLNAYGAAYLAGGRTQEALAQLDGTDSDGDGAANGAEIGDIKYPGDPASKPGQPNAPQKVFTLAQLKALARHSQFLLANSTKQQFDDYGTYAGVTLEELLRAAGVDPADPKITGVTVIAPDGYLKDVSIDEVRKSFPAGKFYAGLDTATRGATCGFVTYPSTLPAGLVDGAEVPGAQRLLLAYERDGAAMSTTVLDVTSGKINGEGPLRLVVPQSVPGKPDRGSQYSPRPECSDEYDFDSSKDHNAGAMVRGVVAVRINPLPSGVEDFDAKNGGWAYVSDSTLIVYGYGITK